MADIHRILGPNAAKFVGMENEIGTLEAGKRADIALLDGNPTLNIYDHRHQVTRLGCGMRLIAYTGASRFSEP